MLQPDVTATRRKICVARQSVDSTGVLTCRATLFECLRHNHLSLRQVPMMLRHKPDLLLLDHEQALSIAF